MKDKTRTLENLLTNKPEPYTEEEQNKSPEIRIAFEAHGEYPDGTKWTRDATPAEEAEYMSWAE